MGFMSTKSHSASGKTSRNVCVIRKAKKQKNDRKVRGGSSLSTESPTVGTTFSAASPSSPFNIDSNQSSPSATLPILSPSSLQDESSKFNTPDFVCNNPSLKEALKDIELQTNCSIVQNKWHRKFGPPRSWSGEPPPKGSEIFVGKIPRDLFEDELIPVLQMAGELHEVRLMMEPTGFNRGFAYVKYSNKLDAQKAVEMLNNYEIRSRHYLGVMKSVDNNRLFIGGIPKTRRQEELLQEMKRLTDDVQKVILYADVNDKSQNRGFAFVEYKDHSAAYSARQKLMKTPPLLWGSTLVKVDWAEPEREVDEQTMSKVRILYVRNLALSTTDQQLRHLFSKFGGAVERVKKIKDYAFVHYATREQAEEAKNNLQNYVLDKCEIDISWSKPVTNRDEYNQRRAASKALSCGLGGITPPIVQAGIGINGEPIIINQRTRTAAGAQGYISARPYPLRPRPNEEAFHAALQSPFVYPPNFHYFHDTTRTTIETLGLAAATVAQPQPQPHPQPQPQHMFTTEGIDHLEEFVNQDLQVQLAHPQLLQRFHPLLPPSTYNMVPTQAMNGNWANQSFIQPGSTAPAFISSSPYIVSAPPYATMPGTYSPHPFYAGQMMAQLPSITGSNMSIDRT